MADGYLIGENLRRKLGAVVKRGEAIAGSPGRKTGPLPAGDTGYFQEKNFVTVNITKARLLNDVSKYPQEFLDIDDTSPVPGMCVGHAIDLQSPEARYSSLKSKVKPTQSVTASGAPPFNDEAQADQNGFRFFASQGQRLVNQFGFPSNDPAPLPRLESGRPVLTLATTLASSLSDNFGIIKAISEIKEESQNGQQTVTGYSLTVQIRGIVTCRVLAFGYAARVMGPLPVPWQDPQNPNVEVVRSMWRPLPVLSDAGSAMCIGLGPYVKVRQDSEWPRIYEAAVML